MEDVAFLCSYLQQFFTDPGFGAIVARPGNWDDRFRNTLDELADVLVSHVEQDEGPTPFERMGASQRYVEIERIRQLERGAPTSAASVRLKNWAIFFEATMDQLSRYLSQGEVHDFDLLLERNQNLKSRFDEMHRLCPQYQRLIASLNPGGEIAQFLEQYRLLVLGFDDKAKGMFDDIKKMMKRGRRN